MLKTVDRKKIWKRGRNTKRIMEYRQKDDYYLYLAEFKSGNKIKEAVDQSLNAYQTTSTTVEKRAANLDGHTQYSTHSTCTVAFESPPMHCTNAS